MPGKHYVIIGLGGNGFRASCGCGWSSEPSWDRAAVALTGDAHKRAMIEGSKETR
jgi:hypothetical protein